MAAPSTIVPIPVPPQLPILGHAKLVDPITPYRSNMLLAKQYGEIFRLNFITRKVLIVSSQELVNEICDEKKFRKVVQGPLLEVRTALGDALFTAFDGEEMWGIEHRILMPAFGPGAIHDMFDPMLDINSQLLEKWERYGPDHVIDPTDDFTRLAFDTIAITTMDYRFNSFYSVEPPEFIGAMGRFLIECGLRARRPSWLQAMMIQSNAQFNADMQLMSGVCDKIVAYRKEHPTDKKDLLNTMLYGKDPKTGRGLSDENISHNLLTFLIAGHETTSGLLSSAVYGLLTTPSAYKAIQDEIDHVVGTAPLQLSHLSQLKYVVAVMRETLRVYTSVPVISLAPYEDVLLGGKYEVKKDETLAIDAKSLHRDPKVWGDDADEFKPERMLDGKFEALPPNSWKPFGIGTRACIGRALAWQEAQMMLATLFQKFDLRMDDPSYQLQLKQTLTLKPYGLRIHAIPRSGFRPVAVPQQHAANGSPAEASKNAATEAPVGVPLYVYFGSNSGSCEGFAQSVANDAAKNGFHAKLGTLDSILDNTQSLPTDGPVVILTASYEGQPADNAGHFVEWIKGLTGSEFKGVRYAVFGAGNHDWVQTYQAIPTLIDKVLAERGADRLMERCAGDAGGPDLFGEFDAWEAKFWVILAGKWDAKAKAGALPVQEQDDFVISVSNTTRAATLRQPDLSVGKVVENRLLTAPGASEKRHIEFELPASMEYRAGDYLAILPINPVESVHRVLSYFSLAPDAKISIKSKGPTTTLPDEPISAVELLSVYVELGQPATKRNLEELLNLVTPESATAAALKGLVGSYKAEVVDKRLSVLDILEIYPDIKLSLKDFIKMLPSMRIRQYSISSSPIWKANHCTLTITVVRAPALHGHGQFLGVSSNYLANLKPGDNVNVAVRPSSAGFHLPADVSVPVVMFCAGSGFAPMRGFIQERAEQLAAGQKIGSARLFVGCRSPEEDFLYADAELNNWIEAGVVKVHPAFSRQSGQSLDCKYVQDRAWKDREDIKAEFRNGARFYMCGMSGMSNAVRQRCIDMIREERQCSEQEAAEAFLQMSTERFSTDVFG